MRSYTPHTHTHTLSLYTSLCLALTDLSQRLSSAAVRVEEEEREGERLERQMRASLLREAAHRRYSSRAIQIWLRHHDHYS